MTKTESGKQEKKMPVRNAILWSCFEICILGFVWELGFGIWSFYRS
jgi:hypothetical protein